MSTSSEDPTVINHDTTFESYSEAWEAKAKADFSKHYQHCQQAMSSNHINVVVELLKKIFVEAVIQKGKKAWDWAFFYSYMFIIGCMDHLKLHEEYIYLPDDDRAAIKSKIESSRETIETLRSGDLKTQFNSRKAIAVEAHKAASAVAAVEECETAPKEKAVEKAISSKNHEAASDVAAEECGTAPKEKAVESAIAAETPAKVISPKNHEVASDVAVVEECETAPKEKAVEKAIAAKTPAKAISPITAVPTISPTANPTATPTAIPTAVPTANPTAVPAAVPTFIPTAAPPTGLTNLGNTCYMNAGLQLLFHSKLFDFLCTGTAPPIAKHNSRGSKGCITNMVRNLFITMNGGTTPFKTPLPTLLGDFKGLFEKTHTTFAGYSQQCASEFLMNLINDLHEDTNMARNTQGVIPTRPEVTAPPSLSDADLLAASKQSVATTDKSPIYDLFSFQMMTILGCNVCSSTSRSVAPQTELQLDLGDGSEMTLEECVRTHFSREYLDGSNTWTCSTCDNQSRAMKWFRPCSPPPILVIVLKRFGEYGPHGSSDKNQMSVTFGEELDLTEHFEDDLAVYDLKGIINHESDEITSGHYTADVLGRNNTWYWVNDGECVRNESPNFSTAYVLLFHRRDDKVSIPVQVPTPVPEEAISPITAVPTANSTANPTAAPTAIPTAVPTANPAAVPAAVPTAVSTAVPPSKEFMISENVIFTNDSEEPVHAVILEIDTCMNPTVYLILLPDESQIRTEGKRLRRFDDVLSPEPPSEVFMIDEYVIFNDDSEGDVPVEIVEIDPSVHPTAYVILLPNGSQIRTEGKRLRRLVDVMQSE